MTNDWLIAGLPAAINPAVCPRPATATITPVANYQQQASDGLWIIKQMARKSRSPPHGEISAADADADGGGKENIVSCRTPS